MDRLACISLPSLPLQIALRGFPPDSPLPVAVIREDRPTSPLLQLNPRARAQGLRPGLRYSEALTVVPDLRAVRVSPADLEAARTEILGLLRRFSPVVETCPFDQGAFWVGAAGLSGLFGTEAAWGGLIRDTLTAQRYRAVVVVGCTRGGTYVGARKRRSTVLGSAAAEARLLARAPLSVFPLPLRARRLLERLKLSTLQALLAVPAEDLVRRFGPELTRELRALAALDRLPLQGTEVPPPALRSVRLEPPVGDREALVPLLSGPLRAGLDDLARRGRLLTELRVVFVLEEGDLLTEVLRPAEPTRHLPSVLRLLVLRLERLSFPGAVEELRLGLSDGPEAPRSGELFEAPRPRELARGAEALALIRARWGNAAVVRPVLVDSHVPGEAYRWDEVDRLRPPAPRATGGPEPTAVRRVPLAPPAGGGGPGRRLAGPYRLRVSGGPGATDKEYWFLQGSRREVRWVSWDRQTGGTALEGLVD